MSTPNILNKNADFIVLDKPSGISTHSSPGDKAQNLIDMLVPDYPLLYPVMRLDNGTSGLIVLGLDEDFVKDCLFQNKEYLALVLGTVQESGIVDRPLAKKQFVTRKKVVQDALTEYKVLTAAPQASLLQINISTGRHHQIRKHLRSIGHPILGDFRHGYNDRNLEIQERYGKKLRLCLHCSKLEFVYKNKVYVYSLPLPDDLNEVWTFLTA